MRCLWVLLKYDVSSATAERGKSRIDLAWYLAKLKTGIGILTKYKYHESSEIFAAMIFLLYGMLEPKLNRSF